MTWFKVDDGFWSHPKTALLSANSISLWVKAGAYCCQHLTDGEISKAALKLLGTPRSAQQLVDAGMWDKTATGWRFHDWHRYQETSEDVQKRRDQARERQRAARAAREEKRAKQGGMSQRDKPRDKRRNDSETDDVTSDEVFNPRPDPTRPVVPNGTTSSLSPSDETSPAAEVEPSESEPAAIEFADHASRRTTSIPDDWQPTAAHRLRAVRDRLDIDTEADNFRNHALSVDRRCAGHSGWDAAFHNWLAKAKPGQQPGRGAASAKAEGWLDIANAAADPDEPKAIER